MSRAYLEFEHVRRLNRHDVLRAIALVVELQIHWVRTVRESGDVMRRQTEIRRELLENVRRVDRDDGPAGLSVAVRGPRLRRSLRQNARGSKYQCG